MTPPLGSNDTLYGLHPEHPCRVVLMHGNFEIWSRCFLGSLLCARVLWGECGTGDTETWDVQPRVDAGQALASAPVWPARQDAIG